MPTRRELAAEEDAAWVELEALVDRLSPAQMEEAGYIAEGWSVKDLLGHLAAWMAEAACVLEQIRVGTYRSRRLDIDAMNADFYEANRDQPLPVVRAEWFSSHTRMLVEWNRVPPDTPDGEEWFGESGTKHYAEHIDRLREWVEELQARG